MTLFFPIAGCQESADRVLADVSALVPEDKREILASRAARP
jgi:hypothetical protein